MRQFKVIALSVGSDYNAVYNSGDTVSEDQFPEGNADQLVKKGFLEEIFEEPTAQETFKHIVTQEDLNNNPDWVENDIKVGDEIEVPVKDDTQKETKPRRNNKK